MINYVTKEEYHDLLDAIETEKAETIFRDIYERLFDEGCEVSPRGQKVIEVENFNYTLPPFVRFTNFKSRGLKLDYIKREFRWYLNADPKDLSIVEHAKLWEKAVTSRGTINSNYGQYIFGPNGQFNFVLEELKKDKDSRRASIMILSSEHIRSGDSDLPCTYSINFRIRDNELNMTVRMRSQDAIFGMGSDAPCFSFIHEMMLRSLQEFYPDLEYGDYYHSADSFHVYERHFELLKKIIAIDDNGRRPEQYLPVECPMISGKTEVDFLIAGKYDTIPSDFQFARWLNSNTSDPHVKASVEEKG